MAAWPVHPRLLVAAAAMAFLVSTMFPLVASAMPGDHVSSAIGIADALLAFVLVALGAYVEARGRARIDDRSRRVSHYGTN